ncbi:MULTISPECIES: GH36-type glycosyl hydrolase domain-containing protein [unclassified Duganella]|uniref:GH36-type glycosyl hydrolase domain-containing protein n=1 Tax=unclassified Duganella TaxID=2636909 RepID=UPI000E346AC5|nr:MULTISPECIES: glycosyl transferase [unclassified Duganella]RFP18339.1 glycosyl transferase [Duganella sp. BJB475]RFP35004.1 glycosyl transferase [Duganella sp. BJB476]
MTTPELSRHAQLLSNGSFTTLITGAGTGFSRVGESMLSRWNGDRIEDAEGYFFYLRDAGTGQLWSLGAQPGAVDSAGVQRSAGGDAGSCWIDVVAHGIGARMEVAVDPLRDVELRSVLLSNLSDRERAIELTSYLEVVLNRQSDEASHPAFSKLFVQTEHDDATGALLARRRPRGEGEAGLWMVHAAAGGAAAGYETDRTRFIGRGRDLRAPAGLDGELSATAGNVLDPAFSLRRSVVLGPGEQVRLVFMLGAAPGREQALALTSAMDGDGRPLFAAARAAGQTLQQQIGLSDTQAEYCHRLAGAMLYGQSAVRVPASTAAIASAVFSASAGITEAPDAQGSDLPAGPMILLRSVSRVDSSVDLVLRARRYWAALGLPLNVLLLTADGNWPQQEGVYQRKPDDIAPADMAKIELHALLIVRGGLPALGDVDGAAHVPAPLPEARADGPALAPGRSLLRLFNGNGGFSDAGDEYVIRLGWDAQRGLHRPPLAWTNAISNEGFGFLVSESGAGYTWSRNSRVHRLTPWYNDPIRDPHGEALYLRDEDSGVFWSPLPGPAPAGAGYEVAHGFGYSRFSHVSHELEQETVMFVPRHDPVKIVRIRVTNRGAAVRRLSLFSYQRLVLGGTPADSSRFVVTEYDASGVLLAHNPLAGQFSDGVTFAAALAGTGAAVHHSADRAAFIGRHGSPANPAALAAPRLDGATGAGLDPCAAFQAVHELAPGATLECVFLLGETVEREAALDLVQRYKAPGAVQTAFDEITAFWRHTVGAVQVTTPVPAVDLMQNGWLAYQNLSCRIWGRSAYYQSGGALGYRDQLQDSSAMIYARPDLTRQQIRIHAAHQFVEGDVLHWWHTAPMEQGLRTRFADDLLWLPYVTAFYITTTGDWSVLDEIEPFLSAPLLEEGEDEIYLKPELSGSSGDVYEHCCRALDRSLTQGAHGLPLMGTGDWNDGMNRVGREGRGESVWMGFFLSRIIKDFLPICEKRGDSARVMIYSAYHDHLDHALNADGWDGEWYRRAFYDNGAVIGSKDSDECQIDALAQAWAVISEVAPPQRAKLALDAMEQRLVSVPDKLIRLLTPAFVNTPNDPGYIKGYVAGVRENGGQYTHAACWAVRAMAEAGRRDRAAALLEMLSPASHALDPAAVAVYQVEPYVIAADIYGEAPHVGRGGWTWYTGSSGWMYRVGLESVLGFRIEGGNTIVMSPRIPDEWPEFTVKHQLPDDGGSYEIVVRNPQRSAGGVLSATLDGAALAVYDGIARIPMLRDGAAHRIELVMG